MSLRRLRKSDIRSLAQALPIEISPKDDVQSSDEVLLINDKFSFFKAGDDWVPSLPLLLERPETLPRLVVDMGAVRFVVRGADIMRPGITEIPDGQAGALVQVVDERNKKPLAVGRMLFPGDEMRSMEEGKVVENLHYVGDELWQRFTN